jgi:hypothetical protein
MSRSWQRHAPAALFAALLFSPAALSQGAPPPDVLTVDLLADSPVAVEVEFQLDRFESTDITIEGQLYKALEIEAEGNANTPGDPSLPRVARSVLLPDHGAVSVRVKDSTYYELEGIDIVPSKGPITRDIDPATVPFTFGPAYTEDAFFPASPASLREPYIMRDVRGVVVEANLFQYNPVRHVLRVYESMTLEVVTTSDPGVNEIDRSMFPARPDRSFTSIYRRHFLNGSSQLAATAGRTTSDEQCGDMLIVSDGAFIPTLQPFIAWKNSIGIHTTVVDVASIGNNPTAIKNFITSVYNSSNLAYVLLVGDAPQVTSFTYQGGYSDPTYSTITPDWYPDLFVGRFSAQTVAQVQTQVDRTLAYEATSHDVANGGWDAQALGIASDQGPGHYGEYDNQHMNNIRSQYLAGGYRTVYQVYDPSGTKTQIKNAIQSGTRFINYCGHGSSSSWGTTGYSSNDVNQLTNVGKLPVIQSVACVNGDFSVSSCFAETWLRATSGGQPTGAAAVYMSTINQYWNEPMYGQACHGNGGKYSYVGLELQDADFSVCGLWFAGSSVMMDISGNSGRDMFMTWTCFGDPSLCILGQNEPNSLLVDNQLVPQSSPSTTGFTVARDSSAAGDLYFLLVSLSGQSPGTPLAGGEVLPLNFDTLTTYGLGHPFGPVFFGFFGTLDASGEAFPSFTTGAVAPLDPALIGASIDFAAATWSNPSVMHATNAVTLTVTP